MEFILDQKKNKLRVAERVIHFILGEDKFSFLCTVCGTLVKDGVVHHASEHGAGSIIVDISTTIKDEEEMDAIKKKIFEMDKARVVYYSDCIFPDLCPSCGNCRLCDSRCTCPKEE